MTSPALELPRPSADWPPALRLLLGTGTAQLWDAVLAPLGGRLGRLRPTGTTVQPGGAATVRYSADVVWADGRATRESLTATTGARIPIGAAVLERTVDGESVRVGVWRWPLDPALPGLAWATRAALARDHLLEAGLDAGPLRLRLRSYRPGRRAVVEATTGDGRLFLKIVRPALVTRLVERHAALAADVPVAPVLAATDDGVVVLPGLPGTPLRDLLRGDGTGLPGPDTLHDLLDALPATAAQLPSAGRHRPGDALSRVADHARVLALAVPDLRPRLDGLVDAIGRADPGEHPLVPIHGDFYEAQLLVDRATVTGLLDVDTVGRGHRIDDWATLVGHLVLLEQILDRPTVAARYRAELLAAGLHRWPAAQLRPRVAAVLVGLATGPFRVLQDDWARRTGARLALAEEWAAAG